MAASSDPNELEISIDLGEAEDNAKRAAAMLGTLRKKYDLRKWEYTRQIRIAPLEIPHSHPVLTLNGFHAASGFENEDKFLQTYLHEQVHWAITLHREKQHFAAVEEFKALYPGAHTSPPDTANSEHSTYLHLIVNYFEIEALSEFVGLERARELARDVPFYKWIYKTVLSDRARIESVLKQTGILPLAPASGR